MIDELEILDKINRIQKDFYRTKSLTDFKLQYDALGHLINLYYNLTGERLPFIVPNINGYLNRNWENNETLEEYFKNQKEHNELASKVLSTFNKSDFDYLYYIDKFSKISNNKLNELICEFLLSFNPKILTLYEKINRSGMIEYNSKNYGRNGGATIYDFNEQTYIVMNAAKDISRITPILHELGHAYAFHMLDNKSKKQKLKWYATYYEMPSSLMEIALNDFMRKNHILMCDTTLIRNIYLRRIEWYFEKLKKLNDKSKVDDIRTSFVYSYGYYLSLLISDKVQEDKDVILRQFDDYLSYQGLLNYDEQLELFGLDRNKLKDMEVLEKRLDEHNDGVKKYVKK